MPHPAQAGPVPIVAVGAVVVDGAGRVLLVRRGRPPSAGAWTLPGGRVEQDEAFEAAIVREIREETALAARVVCALGRVTITSEGSAYAIHEYLLVPLSAAAAPRPGDDAADVRWVERAELDWLGVFPDAIGVIDGGLAEARARGLLIGPPPRT
jgi:ADP-ribose pyrophosphatase YjhB (NUDIX family)